MKTKKNDTSVLWTQDKINDLISLYKTNDCLWNALIEDYKSREKRDAAISLICATLDVTREQFSKKVHNLRNQFNYEAKKIHQRNDNLRNSYRSKWEYYDKLLFLKNVIAPRSGPNYVLSDYEVQNQSLNEFISIKRDKTQPDIVHILDTKTGDLDHNVLIYQESSSNLNDDNNVTEQQLTSNNTNAYPIAIQRATTTHEQPESVFQENVPQQMKQKVDVKIKRQEMTTRSKKKQISSPITQKTQQDNIISQTTDILLNDSPTKKVFRSSSSFGTSNTSPQLCSGKQKLQDTQDLQHVQSQRDEYDLFGEFVSNELKNLNHDISRKKLKRRIMKAMLDIANEDDELG